MWKQLLLNQKARNHRFLHELNNGKKPSGKRDLEIVINGISKRYLEEFKLSELNISAIKKALNSVSNFSVGMNNELLRLVRSGNNIFEQKKKTVIEEGTKILNLQIERGWPAAVIHERNFRVIF